MMKIAFAAAVLMPASLLGDTIPAKAQNLKMAQGVDVQIRRDRDRRWNDSDVTVGFGSGGVTVGPRQNCRMGDHYGRTGRRPHNHAQGAPLRLIYAGERKWPRLRGHFGRVNKGRPPEQRLNYKVGPLPDFKGGREPGALSSDAAFHPARQTITRECDGDRVTADDGC
jgi:hypothetical protein